MPNLTTVTLTSGVPTAGDGVVSTLDGIISATNGPVAIKAASTPPAATDPALVVSISPNSVNANGQATMVNSAPVVIASNQSALPTAGDVAADSADTGNPVKTGAKGAASLVALTPVTDADRANNVSGLDGALVTRSNWAGSADIVTGNASNTDGTTTSCLAASGDAAIKTYLQSVMLTNMSSTGIYVEIKDDTTVKITLPLPANGGCVVNFPVPIPGTANKAWFFDPSAAATTVYCSMIGFKSKV